MNLVIIVRKNSLNSDTLLRHVVHRSILMFAHSVNQTVRSIACASLLASHVSQYVSFMDLGIVITGEHYLTQNG